MKYEEWLDKWMENYIVPSTKIRTSTRYKEIINQHLIPKIGHEEVDCITPLEMQCFVTKLLNEGNIKNGQGLSSNSVNSIITVLQTSLKTAYSLGVAKEYCGDKIKRPKTREKKVESFTVGEQKKIEKYIMEKNTPKLFGIILCLYTGLRIGELLALEWEDIDFKNKQINICKTCYYGKNQEGVFGRITYVPKTQASIRVIPIPKQLVPIMAMAQKNSCSSFVVSNGKQPISTRSYQRTFASILKKLEIPHRGFHSLRHTFATRAIECGVDVKTLSEVLGHKSPNVTLNRYAHSLDDHKKEMMNRVGKLL